MQNISLPHTLKPPIFSPVVALLLVFLLAPGIADAQSHTGVLSLDSIPSNVRIGDTVVFSGYLTTTSGYIVPDATIYIKDDVTFGSDNIIKKTTTDDTGRFYVTWTAQSRNGAWDFYATFNGWSDVSKARSTTYSVKVSSSYSGNSNTIYSTDISLYQIPSSAYAGDSVTFQGKLASGNSPISNAVIQIKEDDPLLPDQTLASGRTGSNGMFSIQWPVSAGIVETEFDIYAAFEGSSSYKKSRSYNQVMSVYKHGGFISLDPFPNKARIGDVITFSGTLNLDGVSSEGAVVYIKDEDSFNPDDLLATGYVNSNGRFSASWIVSDNDPNYGMEIFAVFEGNANLARLVTDQVKLYVSGFAPPPPQDYSDSEYMKMYYSLDIPYSPHVAIIPSPDSYSTVQGHIVPAMEGINMWTSQLEQKYGGNWDVSFEVVLPGTVFFESQPDIVMNLITPEQDIGCKNDWYGIAYIDLSVIPKPTKVCSVSNETRRSNVDVGATAAHEFIHAMGLGHAFNKNNDMMCSNENGIDTCAVSYPKSKTPSNLNLEAVAALYGVDGFTNPNSNVVRDQKFYQNSPQGYTPKSNDQYTAPSDNADYERVNVELDPGWHYSHPVSGGVQNYHFATAVSYDGFELYVVTPDTDTSDFLYEGQGYYYTCEEHGKSWHKKTGTCNVASGAKIVLYNSGEHTINISGWIDSQN